MFKMMFKNLFKILIKDRTKEFMHMANNLLDKIAIRVVNAV